MMKKIKEIFRRIKKFFRTLIKQRVVFPGGTGYLMGVTMTTLEKRPDPKDEENTKVKYEPEMFFIIEPKGKHKHGYLIVRHAASCTLLG